MENSPMDFSRESQTSTNTSECESVEVTNCTKSRSFVERSVFIPKFIGDLFFFYNNRVILVLKWY